MNQKRESSSVSYCIIYKAASSTVHNLSQVDSTESKLVRGRGRGTVLNQDDETDERTVTMELEEGYLKPESGFMMRFVNEDELDLSVFDVLAIPDKPSYAAPQSTIDELPAHISSHLELHDFVKVNGWYDSDSGTWESPEIGWDPRAQNPYDFLMQAQSEIGGMPAVDFLVSKYGPEHWTVEAIAEERDVEPRTVRRNVAVGERELGR